MIAAGFREKSPLLLFSKEGFEAPRENFLFGKGG
jgi:hypothetical protein